MARSLLSPTPTTHLTGRTDRWSSESTGPNSVPVQLKSPSTRPRTATPNWSRCTRGTTTADLLYRDQIQEEGNGLLSKSLAGHQDEYPDVRIHRVVTEERPAKRLLHASETAQLVVLGSHGRGGFPGMTLGSVS